MPEPKVEELTGAMRHEATTTQPAPNSCNRHADCIAAVEVYKEKHGGEPPYANFHCIDECCEDCFGS